ncbi:MAG TPA: metal-dependent transcriptional regulator [Candidatus Eisenbergiella stercoravium]|nr:metal-dependent transcriptional regulator [Candidatus Eisenbergiella stercoravium]
MHVNESAENYLETILILSKEHPVVRSVDIAEELGFKKSSVSVAMKNLREKQHITVSKEGFITLTDSGRAIAEMIYERHELLSDWLTRLGVDPKVAVEDACRIEHVISAESFEAIKRHIGMKGTKQESGK